MSTIQIKCPKCGNDTFKVLRRAKPKDAAHAFFPTAPPDDSVTCSRCGFKTTRPQLAKDAAADVISKVREIFKK
jgi:ribosomal protein L37E